MDNLAYYNGIVAPYSEIRIPLSDRSVFFGDAIYEVMVGRGGICYQLDEHYERLAGNASHLSLCAPEKEKLREIAARLTAGLGVSEFMLYLQLSRDKAVRSHSYGEKYKTNLLVTVSELSFPVHAECVGVVFAEDIRYKMCNIKTTNLLPAVIASQNAELSGCEEAVFIGEDGYVTECAHSNVFILNGRTLKTHPKSHRILPGITRDTLISLARNIGVETVLTPFTPRELLSADEIFITSTTKLLRRVSTADGVPCGMKNAQSAERFFELIYHDFLEKTGF